MFPLLDLLFYRCIAHLKRLRSAVQTHWNGSAGRLVLFKKDLIDDLEDLIKRDLINEGFTEQDFAEKIPERKKELAKL